MKDILDEINTALAWGSPDNESVGYSHSQYHQLLRACRDEIQRLRGGKMVCKNTLVTSDDNAAAIKWWSRLSAEEASRLAEKHFPHLPMVAVNRSTSNIVKIWRKEANRTV